MKETAGLVSIILPAYNAEAYIETCIDSILSQTYPRWELIIIDDGSTDRTPEICANFVEADARIKLIRQQNRGVSAARNVGLENATGEFVAFVDADDLLPANSLSDRVELIADAELAVCGYTMLDHGAAKRRMPQCSKNAWVGDEIVENLAVPGELGYQGYSVNKLFRRDIIEGNGLRFAEDIAYNEDRLFCVAYALHCQKAALSNVEVYFYRQTETGAMASIAKMNDAEYKKYMSEFVAYDRMIKMLEQKKVCYRICTNAQGRASYYSRIVPRNQKNLYRGIKRKIREYGLLLLAAPRQEVSTINKFKALAHMVLMK